MSSDCCNVDLTLRIMVVVVVMILLLLEEVVMAVGGRGGTRVG